MKKLLFTAIVALGSFAFGQTHDFEYEDGRTSHLVPTKAQKDKLQCTADAYFIDVIKLSSSKYEVSCSDYEYTYTYIKDFALPGGGGGGGGSHVPTPAPNDPLPVN